MPNQGTNHGVRYLSGSNLSELYRGRVKLSTVNKWVETSKVSTDQDGRRNEQEILIALIDAKDAEIERLKAIKNEGDIKEEMDKAKLRKLLLEGDIIEIDRDEKQGKLIAVEEAIAEIEDGFTRVKTKLMALPDRLALEISGLSDPTEIRGILADTVREALQELHFDVTGDDGTPPHSD